MGDERERDKWGPAGVEKQGVTNIAEKTNGLERERTKENERLLTLATHLLLLHLLQMHRLIFSRNNAALYRLIGRQLKKAGG